MQGANGIHYVKVFCTSRCQICTCGRDILSLFSLKESFSSKVSCRKGPGLLLASRLDHCRMNGGGGGGLNIESRQQNLAQLNSHNMIIRAQNFPSYVQFNDIIFKSTVYINERGVGKKWTARTGAELGFALEIRSNEGVNMCIAMVTMEPVPLYCTQVPGNYVKIPRSHIETCPFGPRNNQVKR